MVMVEVVFIVALFGMFVCTAYCIIADKVDNERLIGVVMLLGIIALVIAGV